MTTSAHNNVVPYPGTMRAPLHDLEAEKALLGAIMIDNKVWQRVAGLVEPADFAVGFHGDLFERMGQMIDRRDVVDPITLKPWYLAHDGLADLSSGEPIAYIAELVASVANMTNVPHYAHLVADLSAKRRIVEAAQDAIDAAYGGQVDAKAVLDAHETRLTALAIQNDPQEARTWADYIDEAGRAWEAAHRGDNPPGITTGLADLDDALGGGFLPATLVVEAARPSMGKTALALRHITAAAQRFQKEGRGAVQFFSLEQAGEDIVTRDIVGQTGIAMPAIQGGRLNDQDMKYLFEEAARRRSLPVFMDDGGGMNVQQIARIARRSVRRHDVRLIVIDYLGFMDFDDRYRGNRTNEIAEATKALKALAKELSVPVVLLSQLSRQVEMRENKRPQLSDLRDSGSIEQDADIVIFIYRDEYYLEKDGGPTQAACKTPDDFASKLAAYHARLEAAKGKAELIIAKNRNGPIRTVHVGFNPLRMRFGDLERGLV